MFSIFRKKTTTAPAPAVSGTQLEAKPPAPLAQPAEQAGSSAFRQDASIPQDGAARAASPPNIVARVRDVSYIAQLAEAIRNPDERPVSEVLVGDIHLLFAVDHGNRYQMLSPALLPALGLTASELRAAAAWHLPDAITTLRQRRLGPVVEFADDDDMVAATMLLPDFWKGIERELGGPLVAVFPYAYSAFVARADAEGIAAIRERIVDGDMPLSERMYRCSDGAWSVDGS